MVEDDQLKWKLLGSRHVLQDKWISVRADICQMPNGRVVEPFYVIEYPTWVAAVALTRSREILLVRQYRHGVGEVTLELPAGTVDEVDLSPANAMRRELLEETGYRGDKFLQIGRFSVNPSNQNNLTIAFFVEDVEKASEPSLDDTEEIEVILLPFCEVFELIKEGKFFNSAHIASILLAAEKFGLR
ncbi:MAG: NUDIX hydrolase [Synergistetes bacterium]|nr:NUDIX hydrolase [Synergistota bacterium]